jgi:hypothetical protein
MQTTTALTMARSEATMSCLRTLVRTATFTAFLAGAACDKRSNDGNDLAGPGSTESGSTESGSTSGSANDSSGTTGAEYPVGTCTDVLPAVDDPHPVDTFWACAWWCGIDPDNDTYGLPAAQARMSYDQLQPGQPDGCYELRTALYQCFDAITCPEVAAFREASNAGTDGPCTAEYYALEPNIPECGI